MLKHLSFLCLPHRGSPNGALWTVDKPPLTSEEGFSFVYHAKQHKRRVDLYNTQDMLTLYNKVVGDTWAVTIKAWKECALMLDVPWPID